MSDSLPRLLLVSPLLDASGAAEALPGALTATAGLDVAALLLRGGGLDDAALGKAIGPLVAAAQSRDIAVLLEDRPELLAPSGADGLHLSLSGKGAPIKELRRRFGEGVILGAGCGASRHLAMTAGEQGADYIGFGEPEGLAADPELVAWWEAVMTPPQVAFGIAGAALFHALVAAGADFLGLSPAFWMAGGDASKSLKDLLASPSAQA